MLSALLLPWLSCSLTALSVLLTLRVTHTSHVSCVHAVRPQVLANYIPTAGFALVVGMHPIPWLAWLAAHLLQSYETHSG